MKKRNLTVSIILCILTLGIYHLYWISRVSDETEMLIGSNLSPGRSVAILTVLTLGIYYFYWAFHLGARIGRIRDHHSRGALYLIFSLIGLGILVPALTQQILNEAGREKLSDD